MPRKRRKGARLQQRAQSNYAWHRRVPWVAVGAAAVILVVGVLVARSLFGIGGGPGRFTGPGSGVGNHPGEGQPIAFASYPPTYGPHWAPTTWGFHSEPVPDERVVHNLEHGGVVASYNNIPAESLAALQALLTTYPRDEYNQVKLVIRPYDKIPAGTIVLTAWNWVDELRAYDDARVRAFMDAHLNKCCEDVP
jgi:hypothetical protein